MPITVPRRLSELYSETMMLRLETMAPMNSPAKARKPTSCQRSVAIAESPMPTTIRDRQAMMWRRRPILSARGEMKVAPRAMPKMPALSR